MPRFTIIFAMLMIGTYAVAFNPYQDVSERLKGAHEVGLEDVVFVIRSQAPSPHVERARRIKDDIAQQCRLHNLDHPDVVLLHERYGGPYSGHWTLLPALPKEAPDCASRQAQKYLSRQLLNRNADPHTADAPPQISLVLRTCAVAFNPYQDVSERLKGAHEVGLEDVVFVIRSQAASPHVERARRIKDDIAQQCRLHNLDHPDVVLLHERYGGPYSGHWTLLPALPKIYNEFEQKKWFFFCEEDTRVNVQGLIALLSRFSSGEDWFLGKSLFDQEATIIHHFRFHDSLSEFIFPDFDAGWILSEAVMKSMVSRLDKEKPKIDFSIDVKHELAHYIWNEESGLHMTGLPQLCAGNIDPSDLSPLTDEQAMQKIQSSKANPTKSGSICVTASPKALPECGPPVPGKNVFFAVKTCEKFHSERVPVVQRTWGRFAEHMVYFSNKADISIPTVDLGVPNTERGHCGKTFAIFDQFLNNPEYRTFPWLAITDDDTIISVSRLQRLLSCYDATKPVMLGERYGYGQVKGLGYDYITGGGG
eukprot:XP_011664882.1 PREDICTED: beta-1,3-glucosyltransferase [Strongylocentrotus purpuratus]